MISTTLASELYGKSIITGDVDREFIARFARVHETAAFDLVLVGYGSTGADGFMVTRTRRSVTTRLGYLIAHRPGFRRADARRAQGRLARPPHRRTHRAPHHHRRQRRRAAARRRFPRHDARYRRTDEYLEVLRRTWTSDRRSISDGEFYRVRGAFSEVKPLAGPAIPIYFGAASAPRSRSAPGTATCTPLGRAGRVHQTIDREVPPRRPRGREPRFSVSVRPILGATGTRRGEGPLDSRAHPRGARRRRADAGAGRRTSASQRLLAWRAGRGSRQALWTATPPRPERPAARRRWWARPSSVAIAAGLLRRRPPPPC